MTEKKAVVVTTEFRGVFFGYLEDDSDAPNKIRLSDGRLCIYWSPETHGVLGLAAAGPNKDCRIGAKVPEITIWKISGIFQCTPEAAAAWELEPWSA